MSFKKWLLENTDDFSRWKNLLLGYLNLDAKHGLSQPLNTLNRHNLQAKLQGLSEFMKLSSETQQQVLGFIEQGNGTMGDLIRKISGDLPEI